MSDDTPYITRHPGDSITAEEDARLQVLIKQDVAARIKALEESIKESGVDSAGNAEKFAGSSVQEWLDKLDERYARAAHDHEGVTAYRRYLKRFKPEPGFDKLLLPHGLGRYPLVDVYELLPPGTRRPPEPADCKLFFYYGHEDADAYGLYAAAYRERIPIGLSFSALLDELALPYTDRTTLEDLLNDFWDAITRDPNDWMPHCQSPWVDECCERHRTVADLQKSGQWSDLRLGIRARKCAFGVDVRGDDPPGTTRKVDVTHADQDTLLVEVDRFGFGDQAQPLDLMILLRS